MTRFLFRKGRRRRRSATYHTDENFAAGWKKRNKTSLGGGRTIFTALTLTFSLGAIYIAMHYVPAYLSPSQIVRVSNADENTIAKDRGPVMAVVGPYWDSLLARRSYIWENESMEVQFKRNGAKNLALIVERCERKLVVEIFDCQVVSQQRVPLAGETGTHMLRLSEPGFYQFREVYSGATPRVVWRRA